MRIARDLFAEDQRALLWQDSLMHCRQVSYDTLENKGGRKCSCVNIEKKMETTFANGF